MKWGAVRCGLVEWGVDGGRTSTVKHNICEPFHVNCLLGRPPPSGNEHLADGVWSKAASPERAS